MTKQEKQDVKIVTEVLDELMREGIEGAGPWNRWKPLRLRLTAQSFDAFLRLQTKVEKVEVQLEST